VTVIVVRILFEFYEEYGFESWLVFLKFSVALFLDLDVGFFEVLLV
jgi:hypothetical protein